MPQRFYPILTFAFFSCQTSVEQSIEVTSKHQRGITDFVAVGSKIWAITKDSSLINFDMNTRESNETVFNNGIKITTIAKDRKENIVIADAKNRIGKFEGGNWNFTTNFNCSIKAIFYTKRNVEYLLTENGLLNVKENSIYLPDSSLNRQLVMPYAFGHYTCGLMDSQDNIWLGSSHGEWGGDLYIFDTKEYRFVAPQLKEFDIELNPIFSFTEGRDGIYFSGGLSHLSILSGYIAKFENFNCYMIFHNEFGGLSKDTTKRDGHYIGPINYNPWDSSLYFYTQYGFYKSRNGRDLSKVEYWISALDPKLSWTYGQPDAAGYGMNVKKIVTTGPGAFLFLTDQNTIGYFSRNELKMFR